MKKFNIFSDRQAVLLLMGVRGVCVQGSALCGVPIRSDHRVCTYIECDRITTSAPIESADQAAPAGGRVSMCRTLYRYVLCDTHVCVAAGVPLPPSSPSPREMSVCLYTTGGRGGEVDQGHWSA